MKKNPVLQDSPPAAGRFSDIFHIAAVRLRSTPVGAEQMSTGHFAPSRSVFNFIGTEFYNEIKKESCFAGFSASPQCDPRGAFLIS